MIGDCFQVNSRLAEKHDGILCHGIVIGTGGEMFCLPFVHAWVEPNDDFPLVLDHSNGRTIELPKELYYAMGQIDPAKVVRYTVQEMRRELLAHEHYGPWAEHLQDHF